MISQVALVGVLVFGQSGEVRELPPIAKADLEWVGVYRASPTGDELSPSDHMQLWLFDSGRYYWIGLNTDGEWRRVGDKLVLVPFRFMGRLRHDYEFWKKSLNTFHQRTWLEEGEGAHCYELKRSDNSFVAEHWPFDTFSKGWNRETVDMNELALDAAKLYRMTEDMGTDESDEVVNAADRFMEYTELAWEFTGTQLDQLAQAISDAKEEDVVPIMMGLSGKENSPKLQSALVQWALNESADLYTRRMSAYFAMKNPSRETIDALLPLRSIEAIKKRIGWQALEQAGENRYGGYLPLAREYFDPEYDGLGYRAAMRYVALFGEEKDVEAAAKLAEGTSSDSHMAKGVILAHRPKSEAAERYLDQLSVQVANLETQEEWGTDLRLAADILFEYGGVEHFPVMQNYIEKDAPGYLYKLIGMFERLDDPAALDYLRSNIDGWTIEIGRRAQKLIDRLEGKEKRGV